MKRILFFILIISSIVAKGQTDDSTKYIYYRYQYGTRSIRGAFDTVLKIPLLDTVVKPDRAGALTMRPQNKLIYSWDGTKWSLLVGGGVGGGGYGTLPSLSQYHFYVGDVSSAPVDAGSGINYQNNVFSLDKYAVVDTIYGSTASGGNLYLFSTSHATKGKIFLSGASAYDVTNQRMGFGTTSPISPLHVVADYTINPNSFITIDQAPYTAMDIGVNSSGQAIIDFSGDLKFRTKAYAARGGGSYTNIPLTISYSTGYLNLGVTPATYSSGGFDVLARNQTTGSVEKVTVTFTETVQEFTGSTSSGITLSNTPMSGKAELYFLNGVLIKSSNISRTGTTVTLSGFTRESSDVITAKYSY